MAYKTLLFGIDDLFEILKPYYLKAAEQGVLEIVAAAELENDNVNFITDKVDRGGDIDIDIAIISSHNNFYDRMKQLESMGIPRDRIIDGRVLKVPNLDFLRLLKEGVAYGVFDKNFFELNTYMIYPRIYRCHDSLIRIGSKSYIEGGSITGGGLINLGKYSSLSWEIKFRLGENWQHNYRNISSYAHFEWNNPIEFYPPQGQCKINIGNDVWIGRGCFLKCANPNKPLVIGDGAVIASDSVVVKNVPPYAIVGGNPAKIIKYRFSEDVIESLLRIKWWDWSLDKIHDNFKYFNDVEKFISLHDK